MKNIFTILTLFFISSVCFGQFEWVDDVYSNYEPVMMKKTKSNQYVILLKQPTFWATKKMIVVDSTGKLVFDYIPDTYEIDLISIYDVIANADSTISITTANASGDSGYYFFFSQLTKFDEDFNIVSENFDNVPFDEPYGEALNDGGFITYELYPNNGVNRKDGLGQDIWTKVIPYDLLDLSITSEDTLVFATKQGLLIMEKETGNVSTIFSAFKFDKIKLNSLDGIVGQKGDSLSLLSPTFNLIGSVGFPAEGIMDFEVANGKIAVLTDSTNVYLFNDSLVLEESFPMLDESTFRFITINPEGLVLAGMENYGLNMPSNGSRGACLKEYSYDGNNYNWSNDVGAIGITPGPAYVVYQSNQYEVRYEYIEVEVKNYGDNPVDELYLYFRNPNPSQLSRKKFDNMGLMPGKTTTLVWGNFTVKTFVAPTGFQEICIWTSHPDFRLDANSTNDGLCMDFLVNDQETAISFGFSIYPNPSSSGSTIAYDLPTNGIGHIRVFNNMGILMEGQKVADGKGILSLDKYPAGLYYVVLDLDGLQVKVLKFAQK